MGKSIATLGCVVLIVGATPAVAATILLTPLADGHVTLQLNGTPGPAVTGQNTNLSQNFPGTTIPETRSIYEFDLPIFTETIVSATFLAALVQNSAPPAPLDVYGYSGNGIVESADALQTSTLFGTMTLTTQVPTGTSIPISVALSPSLIQALSGGFLGLTTTVGSADTVLIASLESTAFAGAMLEIVTQSDGTTEPPPTQPVPEPGTLLLMSGALIGLTARVRRRLRTRGARVQNLQPASTTKVQ